MKNKAQALFYVDTAYFVHTIGFLVATVIQANPHPPIFPADAGPIRNYLWQLAINSFLIWSPIQLFSFGFRRKWLQLLVPSIVLIFEVVSFSIIGRSGDFPVTLQIASVFITVVVVFVLVRSLEARKRDDKPIVLGCGEQHFGD